MNFIRMVQPAQLQASAPAAAVEPDELQILGSATSSKKTKNHALIRSLARKLAASTKLSGDDRKALTSLFDDGAITEKEMRANIEVIQQFESTLRSCVATVRHANAAKAAAAGAPARIAALEKELIDWRARQVNEDWALVSASQAMRGILDMARAHAELFEDLDVRELVERHVASNE